MTKLKYIVTLLCVVEKDIKHHKKGYNHFLLQEKRDTIWSIEMYKSVNIEKGWVVILLHLSVWEP